MPQLPFIDPSAQLPNDGAALLSSKEDKSNKGVANGYAPLDANAKVPPANIPDLPPTAHTHNNADLPELGEVLGQQIETFYATGPEGNQNRFTASRNKRWIVEFGGSTGIVNIYFPSSGVRAGDRLRFSFTTPAGLTARINLTPAGSLDVPPLTIYRWSGYSAITGAGMIWRSDHEWTATSTSDGSMSSSDKAKLDGIASGAEVNVNADWNASSGDAQILNKPSFAPSAHTHGNITNAGAVPTQGSYTTSVTAGGSGYTIGPATISGISVTIVAVTNGSVDQINGQSALPFGTYPIVQGSNTSASHTKSQVFSANLPLITTTSGVITTGTFGTTANTFCQGSDFEQHRLDSDDVHGIYNTAYLAYKDESSNIFHRNLLGWPSGSMLSARGTEQSFYNYGSSPTLFDGTEGWSTTSRPIYYVPIFIKNTAAVQFSLRIPVKNYSGFISAALFAADNYNGSTQPTSNGHMTLVANMGTIQYYPEDETAVFAPGTFGVKRGWHFVALSFSSDPAGKVYRSVYSPNGPTPAEQMFGMQQRRSFIEETTEKQRRIGSVIRRVDGDPTWPPATSTAPKLFNYVENPVTPKLIYQFNGPDGSVAVNNTSNTRPTYMEPSIDYSAHAYPSVQRFNDGSSPSPALLSFASASPQGGYNLLASAVPGGFNINTSTRFQIDFSSASHRITELRFYTRSTSTGPTSIQTFINSGLTTPVGVWGGITETLPTTGTWQQFTWLPNAQLSAISQLQIVGYGGSATASLGNWRVDNIEIRGRYKHPDSPANWSGMNSGDHYFGLSEVVPLFYWGYNSLITAGGYSSI